MNLKELMDSIETDYYMQEKAAMTIHHTKSMRLKRIAIDNALVKLYNRRKRILEMTTSDKESKNESSKEGNTRSPERVPEVTPEVTPETYPEDQGGKPANENQ